MRSFTCKPERWANWAAYYQTNGYNPTNAVPFFQNPNALGTDYLTNYSSSSYNALQVEVRRRTKSGLFLEGNYTWSKVLSDADGDVQNRLQHFLDLANPKIERSRANFDLTHMIKMDGYYELPFGKGHKLSYSPLNRVIGGWTLGGTLVWQSGAPFSILSRARNAESRIAFYRQHRRHQPEQESTGRRGEVPDDGERTDDDCAICHQHGRNRCEHGRRAGL